MRTNNDLAVSRLIMDLQDLIEFYRRNPEVPAIPRSSYNSLFVFSKEEMLSVAHIKGARKEYDEAYFKISVPVSNSLSMEFWTSRATVCTPTKTQTIVVPAREEYTYEKPVEWDCHPLLKPSEEE